MSSNLKIKRVCHQCKSEFVAQKTTTKFCSHRCASRAYKGNLRSLKIELSNKENESISTNQITELQAKDYLSVSEACMIIGISRRTLYRLIKLGKVPVGKFGNRTIIRRLDIDGIFIPINESNSLPSTKELQMTQDNFSLSECYSTAEVREKYNISESALRVLIINHKIPKLRKGWYAYVPQKLIDSLLS